MNRRIRFLLSWCRRIAKAAAALFRWALGAAGLARVLPRAAPTGTGRARGTQPGLRVLAGLLIVTAVVAAIFIALRTKTAPRQESMVLQSGAGLASADRRGAGGEAVAGQPLVACRAEPAAWDHVLSQRQRKGLLFFGGFVVATAALLALGRRLSC